MQQPGGHWEAAGWKNVCQTKAKGREYASQGDQHHFMHFDSFSVMYCTVHGVHAGRFHMNQ